MSTTPDSYTYVNFLPGVYHARDAVAVLLSHRVPKRAFVTWRKTPMLYVISFVSANSGGEDIPEHIILRRAGAGGVFSLLKATGEGASEKFETLAALLASRKYLDASYEVAGAAQVVPLPTAEEAARVEFDDDDASGAAQQLGDVTPAEEGSTLPKGARPAVPRPAMPRALFGSLALTVVCALGAIAWTYFVDYGVGARAAWVVAEMSVLAASLARSIPGDCLAGVAAFEEGTARLMATIQVGFEAAPGGAALVRAMLSAAVCWGVLLALIVHGRPSWPLLPNAFGVPVRSADPDAPRTVGPAWRWTALAWLAAGGAAAGLVLGFALVYGAAGVPDATHRAAFRAARAGLEAAAPGDACGAALRRMEHVLAADGVAPSTWLPVLPPWEGAARRGGPGGCGVAPPARDYWFAPVATCGRIAAPMSTSTARAIVTTALGVIVSAIAALFVLDFRTERREKAARAPARRGAAGARGASAKKNE